MFNFIKNKVTNFKSKNLVHNLLEPLIGETKDFCKGAALQKNFRITGQDSESLTFTRRDLAEKLVLDLQFDDNDKCNYYCLWFVRGNSITNSQFIDYHLVRDRGLV